MYYLFKIMSIALLLQATSGLAVRPLEARQRQSRSKLENFDAVPGTPGLGLVPVQPQPGSDLAFQNFFAFNDALSPIKATTGRNTAITSKEQQLAVGANAAKITIKSGSGCKSLQIDQFDYGLITGVGGLLSGKIIVTGYAGDRPVDSLAVVFDGGNKMMTAKDVPSKFQLAGTIDSYEFQYLTETPANVGDLATGMMLDTLYYRCSSQAPGRG